MVLVNLFFIFNLQKITASDKNNADMPTKETNERIGSYGDIANKKVYIWVDLDSNQKASIFAEAIFNSLVAKMTSPIVVHYEKSKGFKDKSYEIYRQDMDLGLYKKILSKASYSKNFNGKEKVIHDLVFSLANHTSELQKDLISWVQICNDLDLDVIKLSIRQYADIKFTDKNNICFEQVFKHKDFELINANIRKIYELIILNIRKY
ncbi:uncharacterized protein VNE69_01085 [Vairimorpha necatrix]|uniref:Uncharacterized protein n=1 Tax=Vairimorpha necatrix TaxID=6039 RepID=A0AAX4J878_9MICR